MIKSLVELVKEANFSSNIRKDLFYKKKTSFNVAILAVSTLVCSTVYYASNNSSATAAITKTTVVEPKTKNEFVSYSLSGDYHSSSSNTPGNYTLSPDFSESRRKNKMSMLTGDYDDSDVTGDYGSPVRVESKESSIIAKAPAPSPTALVQLKIAGSTPQSISNDSAPLLSSTNDPVEGEVDDSVVKTVSSSSDSVLPAVDQRFSYPSDSRKVSSEYKMRLHPVLKVWKFHTGTDFSLSCGSKVYASEDGVVYATGYSGGYGNRVTILHSNDTYSTYSHLSEFKVKKGDKVKRGEVIASSGSTGYSTGCHLHFEIIKNMKFVQPMNFISRTLSGDQSVIPLSAVTPGGVTISSKDSSSSSQAPTVTVKSSQKNSSDYSNNNSSSSVNSLIKNVKNNSRTEDKKVSSTVEKNSRSNKSNSSIPEKPTVVSSSEPKKKKKSSYSSKSNSSYKTSTPYSSPSSSSTYSSTPSSKPTYSSTRQAQAKSSSTPSSSTYSRKSSSTPSSTYSSKSSS